jgi:hypothetical protein
VTLLHPQQGPAYGYNVHSIERSTAIKEIMPDVSEETLDKLIRSEWRGVDQSQREMYEHVAQKSRTSHNVSVRNFRRNSEVIHDLSEALGMLQDITGMQMPLLDPRARMYRVIPADFGSNPNFCAGLLCPGPNDAILAELLVTIEVTSAMNSEGCCSDFPGGFDGNTPAWTEDRTVIVWLRDGSDCHTLCEITFEDSSLSVESGPDASRAQATISFAEVVMQMVKRKLLLPQTTDNYDLVRLWLVAISCSNQEPCVPKAGDAFQRLHPSTGFERKLTLQLNVLQAFTDATTEGGPRRTRAHNQAGVRGWWAVNWADGIAAHWAKGHPVSNKIC